MNRVFADTLFYVAFLNPRDGRHQSAVRWAAQHDVEFVTTGFVLIELANFMSRADRRGAVAKLLDRLASDPATTVIPVNRPDFGSGCDLYRRRPDKDWSLTDCISFVVMHEHGLRDALTADRHFEQAGFTVLLQ